MIIINNYIILVYPLDPSFVPIGRMDSTFQNPWQHRGVAETWNFRRVRVLGRTATKAGPLCWSRLFQWKEGPPGDSKWPFDLLVGGHDFSPFQRPRLWVQTGHDLKNLAAGSLVCFFWFLRAPTYLWVYFISHYLWIPPWTRKDFIGCVSIHPQKTLRNEVGKVVLAQLRMMECYFWKANPNSPKNHLNRRCNNESKTKGPFYH